MNFEELKSHWPDDDASEPLSGEELLARVQARGKEFERETRKRTWIGTAIFLLPLPLVYFIFGVFPGLSPVIRLVGFATGLFLLACAVVIGVTGGFARPNGKITLPVREYAKEQLRKIDRQAWLFRNLKWWFWTPILLGWAVFATVVLTGNINGGIFSILNLLLVPAMAYFGIRSSKHYLERVILPWQRAFRDSLKRFDGIAD